MAKVQYTLGTGRRKTSVARCFLTEGKGKVTVNGKTLAEYFLTPERVQVIMQALVVTASETKFDVNFNVHGGGVSGQAGACLHALSRALLAKDETNLTPLKANGFLTRDSRMVERKKYGQRGARRRFQFSKR